MTQIKKVKTSEGVQFYPQTHTKAVVDDNGYTTESRLGAMQDEINQAQLAVGAVPSDLAPTEDSTNWVTSGGVYNAIQVVHSELTELSGIVDSGLSGEKELDVSSDYNITNGQAYGNVGAVISTDTNSQFSKVYIAKGDDLIAAFTTHASLQVSSYVQFVREGNIITRRLYVMGEYEFGNDYTLSLEFEENEVGVYVSGVNGSVRVYEKQYINKFLRQSDVVEDVVNEDMPISSKAIYDSFLVEESLGQNPVKGMQSYGSSGQTISFGALEDLEYMRLEKGGSYNRVIFRTNPSRISVSSYVQYVNENNVITRILYSTYSANTQYTFIPDFADNEIAVYVNSAKGFLQVFNSSMEFQSVKNLLRISPPIQSEYSKTDAETNFSYSIFYKNFLHGEIGQVIQATTGSNKSKCLRIPLENVQKITYPLFATTEGFGSAICADGDVVLWFYANTTEPTGTYKTIDVSSISGAEYAYISIYGISDYHITIEKKESVDTKLFLEELLSSDFTVTAPNKALSLTGANLLYQLISNVNIGGVPAGGLHCFNDFGEMPSCVYGDANAFLEDGVDGSGNAIIKYSDVIAKYDALVSAYPAFVTKQTLGYDASNTIEMYSYTFTPKYYKQCIYLQAGVHGWEPDPVFALAEIMYLICNSYGSESLSPTIINNNVLKYIRGNVKIVVVPVVNPWGFNNRADCGIDKRQQAQNNYNGVQLNSAWNGDEPECVYVRNIISSISSELSFAIDMHSTVWTDSLTRYGCFYGGVNRNAENVPTIYRTYEWLYEFYNVKYPSIVQGATVPNPTSGGYASVGYMTGTFNSWIYTTYNVQASTMEFSDHVWTSALHTSVALSVAVNMYLNQILQQLNDEYKNVTPIDIPSSDYYPAKG